jgi:hypothetical protein
MEVKSSLMSTIQVYFFNSVQERIEYWPWQWRLAFFVTFNCCLIFLHISVSGQYCPISRRVFFCECYAAPVLLVLEFIARLLGKRSELISALSFAYKHSSLRCAYWQRINTFRAKLHRALLHYCKSKTVFHLWMELASHKVIILWM